MICSTLNRNAKSYAMAIIGAEHIMRWLPKGTHEWKKFITPEELYDLIRRAVWTLWTERGWSSTRSAGRGACHPAIFR